MVFINHIEVLSGEAAIVEINGPLNSKTSPDFEEYINQLLDKKMIYILLDASQLEFVSSEGIGVMLYVQKKIAERNGFFILYNLIPEVSSLYEILGFDKVFNLASSKIDALQIMDGQIGLRDKGEPGDTGIHTPSLEEDDDIKISEIPETFIEERKSYQNEVKTKRESGETETVAFDPFIVECEKCKTLVRIKQSGGYLCPTCKNELTANSDQTVDFM